ncbi:MAG: hypothetical protein R3C24_02345 [Cyanobacteriota/Melainabacteria group bacterium]|nr:hypothetical protein [Cyanobacteria bacterium HKST-UBA01]MCB9472098.1 hypothetical protein [Candidatus Obscuribacterales bacterium]
MKSSGQPNNSFELFHKYSERLAEKWGLNSASDPHLPAIITSDPNTPRKFLALFAQSTEKDILERLAANPNTPDDVLMGLADHYDSAVRLALANNNRAPDMVIETLVEDDSVNVRFTVASNPNSSKRALEALEDDNNPYVVRRASKTLNRIKALKKKEIENCADTSREIVNQQ